MDFDPGELYDDSYENPDEMAEDNYEEGFEDGQDEEEPVEEETELDSMGNPIFLAAAAGFGHQMGQEELDERQIAENILKNKTRRIDPVKVPLARRKEDKGHMTPFARWSTKANLDHKRTEDEIEYTKEEQIQIFKSEGDWDG